MKFPGFIKVESVKMSNDGSILKASFIIQRLKMMDTKRNCFWPI